MSVSLSNESDLQRRIKLYFVAVAKLVGQVKIVRNVILTRAVKMGIADVHGNAIVNRDGVEFCVMNVSFLQLFCLIGFNGFFFSLKQN